MPGIPLGCRALMGLATAVEASRRPFLSCNSALIIAVAACDCTPQRRPPHRPSPPPAQPFTAPREHMPGIPLGCRALMNLANAVEALGGRNAAANMVVILHLSDAQIELVGKY